jgi:hypothetical protein
MGADTGATTGERASTELKMLGVRLVGAVTRKPGETHDHSRRDAAASVRELQREVSRLNQAGCVRVRTIGERS